MPCTDFGGAAALYRDLAAALAHLGHEVVVLSGNNRPGIDIVQTDGFFNLRFGARYPSIGFFGRLRRAFEVMRKHGLAEEKYGGFDIVEAPEFASEHLLLGLFRQIDVLSTRLISPSFMVARMSGRRPGSIQNWLERVGASHSSIILMDSLNWGRDILRDWRLLNKKHRECPIGIDLDRIDGIPVGDSPVSGRYVLFCGRLTVAKGPHVLAAAAPSILREYPDVKIVFAGADRYMPSGQSMRASILQSIPADLRGSLVFLGRVESWPELVNLYRGASVCVKADSHGNHSFDAMGQMACSRPFVCTKTEGNKDLVTDGINGRLFERESPEQLSDIVVELMADEGLRTTLGRNARRTIQDRFSSRVMASRTVMIYEEELSRS